MQYTERDDPEVTARIEADLDRITATVVDADPSLRSLVLTGGFARGEGAVVDGVPQNDYDLIAFRGPGAPMPDYAGLRRRLEGSIGIHIDLAPVPIWRLPLCDASIFWYETAWRGRTIWGESLIDRIPVRSVSDLNTSEGLRLLVNRAAGLLLATQGDDPHEHRLQAAKALLAAFDVHMLAHGAFPPSQRERWRLYRSLDRAGTAPARLGASLHAIAWAHRFKTDPAGASPWHPREAWGVARRALLDSLPVALHLAGIPSLRALGRRDRMVGRAYYYLNGGGIPGGRRLLFNPTGQVQAATLRLLDRTAGGRVRPGDALACLGGLARDFRDPLLTLEALRQATLQ